MTPEQKQQICIAYLAFNNSVEDLCIQLIEALHSQAPGISSDPVEQFLEEIHKDMIQIREDDPESFETTADEELESLRKVYEEHMYEAIKSWLKMISVNI